MIIIRDKAGRAVSRSKNLRGILDYSRKNEVERVDLYPGPQLGIAWKNGASMLADFADATVMRAWVDRFVKYRNVPVKEHGK